MQEIIFIFYARVFYTFSTVFNKVMNIVFIFAGKRIPNIRKIFGITEKRGGNVTEMTIIKAFTVPIEANRKKRETQRKAVL